MTTTCPHCAEGEVADRFCDTCGKEALRPCPTCGASNRLVARFCTACGTALAATSPHPPIPPPARREAEPAEQKLVTILFADICGSTEHIARLDAEDAADRLAPVLDVVRAAIARAGGLVVRQMGDGLMALFGAPLAAEDHALRACLAALAALSGVASLGGAALPIRIGISSGPVIVRKTGRDDSDYDAIGMTAHLAARLESAAEPGTVLLSHATESLVAGTAKLEPLGNKLLKGLPRPVPVYRLLSAADRPSWDVRSSTNALSTFVGRDAERTQLAAALRRAAAARVHSVAIVGDAGLGKSRLVHEFLGTVAHSPWRLLRVETTAQSTAIPYLVVTALLREFVGCPPNTTADDAAADIAARLPAAAALLGGPAFEQAIIPYLAAPGPAEPASLAAAPAERRTQLAGLLRQMLRHMAAAQPLILLIEDYHWLDASSADLLDELHRGFDGLPLLTLVTTRPERRPGWCSGRAGATAAAETMELRPLSPAEADRILLELLGKTDALATLRAHIIERADGTPFFLEEFARLFHETRKLECDDEASNARVVIPGSVQSILAARIDRLTPVERRILQVAAVVGRNITPALLAAAADIPEAAAIAAVGVLWAANFLAAERRSAPVTYRFCHALTQAVSYDTVLRTERRAVHRRVLALLEADLLQAGPGQADAAVDELAHHALCAEAWPEAARYAVHAGERAARRAAFTEAKAYLETAIDALSRAPPTTDGLMLGIEARLKLRGIASNVTGVLGTPGDMQTYFEEAGRLAEQAGDQVSLARVYISRCTMVSHWGDLPTAIDLSRAALNIMRGNNDTVGIVGSAFALAQALWYAGDYGDALAILLDNIHHARSEAGQQRSAATFVFPAAVFFCYVARLHSDSGNDAAALAAIEEARAVADRYGEPFDTVLVDMNEGAVRLAAGDRPAAIAKLEHALALAEASQIEWHTPMIACSLGRAYVDSGRHAEARTLLERATAFAERNRHLAKRLLLGPPLVRALAEAPQPDMEAALRLAERTRSDARAHGFRPTAIQAEIALARAQAAAGYPARAKATLQTALQAATTLNLPRETAEARFLLTTLPTPTPAKATPQ